MGGFLRFFGILSLFRRSAHDEHAAFDRDHGKGHFVDRENLVFLLAYHHFEPCVLEVPVGIVRQHVPYHFLVSGGSVSHIAADGFGFGGIVGTTVTG